MRATLLTIELVNTARSWTRSEFGHLVAGAADDFGWTSTADRVDESRRKSTERSSEAGQHQ
jgi:hypothetical protein